MDESLDDELQQPDATQDYAAASDRVTQRTPVAPAAKPSPYEAASDRIAAQQQQPLRAAVITASTQDPDRAAKVQRMSEDMNVPASVVDRHFDDYAQRARIANIPIDQIAAQSPAVAAFASQPQNAAVAHDDLGPLAALEYLVALPSRALAQSYFQTKSAELEFKTFLGPLSREEQDQKNTFDYYAGDGSGLKTSGAWYQRYVTPQMQFAAGLIVPAARDVAIGAGTGAVIGAGAGLVTGPGVVPSALAGASFGARTGFQVGLARTAFISSSAEALKEYRDVPDAFGHPIDPDVAKMTALGVGAFNAGLMLGGGHIVGEAVEKVAGKAASMWTADAVKDALRQPGTIAALKDLAIRTGKTTAEMGLFGAGAEAASILGHAIAKIASGQSGEQITSGEAATRIARAAADSAINSVGTMAALPLTGIAFDAMRESKAKQAQAFFHALGEGVGQSKTAQRMPDAVREIIEQATKDGPVSTLYAPVTANPENGQVGWTTYWQSKGIDPAEMAFRVTGSRDAYPQALATGADLPIPTGRYAATLAGTEHNAFFADELRLGPDEMNGREATKFAEQVKQAQADAVAAQEPAPSPLKARLMEGFKRAGVSDKQANDYASTVESMSGENGILGSGGSIASAFGPDAFEQFKAQYGLDVEREGQPAAEAAPQEPQEPQEPQDAAQGEMAPELARLTDSAPELYAGMERRAGPDANYGGPERRNEALDTRDVATAAARMRAENPNIDRDAAAMRANADGVARAPKTRAGEVDNNADKAETEGGHEASAPELVHTRAEARQSGEPAGDRIAASYPRINESPKQRADRTARHYADLFDAVLRDARAVDPNVNEKELRAEFDQRVEIFHDLKEVYRESGSDPVQLLRDIAARGGLFESEGGLTGELKDLKSGTKFGGLGGIQKVFRGAREIDSRGRAVTGLGLDDMLTSLKADEGRYSWLENTNQLLDAIDEVARHGAEADALPGSDELRSDLNIDTNGAWWMDSWRSQPVDFLNEVALENEDSILEPDGPVDTSFNVEEFNQSLFDDTEPPDPEVDTLATGEQQPRLPGAGDVRNADQPMPEVADAPFSLTSEVAKPRTGKQRTLFQTVYHGTPHVFDAFSLHAIGSGEGNQSYGYGLYFTSTKEIAEHYAAELGSFRYEVDGQPVRTGAEQWAVDKLAEIKQAGDAAEYEVEGLKAQVDYQVHHHVMPADYGAQIKDAIDRFAGKKVEKVSTGHVVTAEIPDDENMLDYDKPASQQPPKVQDALRKLGMTWEPMEIPSTKDALRTIFDSAQADKAARRTPFLYDGRDTRDAMTEGLYYAVQGNQEAFNAWYVKNHDLLTKEGINDPTGQQIYENIQRDAIHDMIGQRYSQRDSTLKATAEMASARLNEVGVHGIRYLDGKSRADGEGSHNYVVFDDKLAKITEFNQPLKDLTRDDVYDWAASVKQRAGADLTDFNVFLSDSGDIALLGLSVARGAQRAGLGSAVMQELTRFADLNGKAIELTPANRGYDGSTTSKSRLIKFYERFGFQQQGLLMVREPTLPNARPEGETTLEQERRGAIRFGPERQFTISLLERADPSTFLHEVGHFFLEVMGDAAARFDGADPATLTDAQRSLIADYKTVLEHVGATDRKGIGEAQHETFARTVEAYFMKGEAPAMELQGTFARFRAWLTGVYRSLTNLKVNLTPEVKDVLDRMIASDRAIQDVNAQRATEPMFLTPEAAGMSPEKFGLYRQTIENASRAARDELDRKLFAEVAREQTARWKAQRAEIKTAVEAETYQRPEYRALSAILRGEHPNGDPLVEGMTTEPLKLSREAIEERYGKDRIKRLPRGVVAVGEGLDPDTVAPMVGFESGDAMLTAIEKAPAMKAVIDQEVKSRMFQENGNSLIDGSLHEKAQEAVMNDQRDAVIRQELRALNDLKRTVKPFEKAEQQKGAAVADELKGQIKDLKAQARGGAQTIRAALPPAELLKQSAIARIASLPVGSIQPEAFWSAARRSGAMARDRAARQDFDGAIQAAHQELIHVNLYREATKVKAEITESLDGFKDLNKADTTLAKSRDMDYVNAARSVLGNVGLGPAQPERAEAYLSKLRQDDPEAYEHVSDMIASSPQTSDYRTLSVADFRTVASTVDALWTLALRSKQIEINGERVELREARKAVLDQVRLFSEPREQAGYKKAVSKWDRVKVGLLGFRASARRIEDWVTVVDNGREGPARRAIFDPINNGAIAYDGARADVAKKYAAIVDALPPLRDGQIDARELGYVFTNKQELLGALLHVGNGFEPGSNGDKLVRGRQWGLDGWNRFVSRMQQDGTLTKADYDYAQAVWDLNGSLKDGAQKVHRERFGRYFDEVTAVPFDTPFGRYAGGYYPAIADPFITPSAGERQLATTRLEGGAGGSGMFPSVGRGFTQTRVENYAKPLIMDASQVVPHLNAVLRFTHLSQPVSDVARLVQHPQFRQEMDKIDPAAVSDLIVPYLFRAASQRMFTPMEGKGGRALDAVAREIRTRGAMQVIALNGTVLAEQFTHFPSVLVHPDVDVSRLLGAVWQLSRSPFETAQDIHDASPFMATRSSAGVQEARDSIDRVLADESPLTRGAGWVRDHADIFMRGIQESMDNVTWQAVYDKVADSPDSSHEKAVARADAAVRQALGSYRPQDRAAVEGGTQIVGLLNQFYGFFNTKLNMLGTEAVLASRLGLQRKYSRAFSIYAMGFMVPAMLGQGIKNAIKGKGVLDDEGDDTAAAMLRFWGLSQLEMGARMIPFGGAAVKTAEMAFMGGKPSDIINAPSVTMVENALHAPGEAYKTLTDTNQRTHAQNAKAITDFFTLVGMMSNLPMRPVGQVVNAAHDALTNQ